MNKITKKEFIDTLKAGHNCLICGKMNQTEQQKDFILTYVNAHKLTADENSRTCIAANSVSLTFSGGSKLYYNTLKDCYTVNGCLVAIDSYFDEFDNITKYTVMVYAVDNVEPETDENAGKIDRAREELKKRAARSAWKRGVIEYALELLDDLTEQYDDGDVPTDAATLERDMLNGARDWSQYSWGGCSLIYDGDIAERLCTPSELKITRNGERKPNAREEWLDVQARALFQAARLVTSVLL